ncbi:sulfur oxidation c-type cytochrome SoxX [Hydrogenophaga pseudoflava]|uniref:sulfur oxidation c-type cytochrome SoxX n=1 Tax=Hydrogenophaga pseudoflava TaxID=47421 RepID=UPI0027E5584D|nr:sulfur oxidation c-type cytochrome SoxX [Hydrogenophaga pseudoflava]MDQ7746697.1 sulfur oxidation c-type cytochrome SoxX [Hydrogenophaga pseudoflava]
MKKIFAIALLPLAVLALGACSTGAAGTDHDQAHARVVSASFQPNGIATLEYLRQDDANRLCSAADVAGKPLDEKTAKAIEEAALKTIKMPSDGKFLGDWKEGEKIAQSGRGLTWTDDAKTVNGGNCYNCHQMDKKEISFGNLGPSLYNYGKLRGVTDPTSAAAKPIVEYTWGKLWNSRAYNACSQMPRAGHKGILSEQNLKDVMALLLDPKSPVNQ